MGRKSRINAFPTSGATFRIVWLVIRQELSVAFVASLIGQPLANPKAILNALQQFDVKAVNVKAPSVKTKGTQ